MISVTGFPARTGVGELSIVPTAIETLATCNRPLPERLTDHNSRFRSRHLDLLVNTHVRDIFVTRQRVIQHVRDYLLQRGFLEVETPIMSPSAGGAAARPFVTHSRALGMDVSLRIAPELYLKVCFCSPAGDDS